MSEETTKLNLPMEEKKKGNFKTVLLILLPILILCGILAYYVFWYGNDKKIFETAIDKVYLQYKEYSKEIKENTNTLNLLEKPFEITGTLKLSTSSKTLADWENYAYDFGIGLDYPNNIASLSLGMKDDSTNLVIKYYNISGKQYLDFGNLFSKLIDLEQDVNFKDSFDLEDLKKIPSIETFDSIADSIQKSLKASLDSKKIKKENKNTFVYTLDAETQKNTVSQVVTDLKQNDKAMKDLATLTSQSEEELKNALDNAVSNYEATTEMTITLYTNTLHSEIEKAELKEQNDKITIEKNKFSMTQNNKEIFTLEILEHEKGKSSLSCTIITDDNQKISAKIDISEKKESSSSISGTLNGEVTVDNETITVNLEFKEDSNATIESPNVSNATTFDQMTEQEAYDFYIKVLKAIDGTPLEALFGTIGN